MRPVQRVPRHVLWKTDIYWKRYKKHCIQDNGISVSFKVGTLGPHAVLPAASLLLYKTLQNSLLELPSAALSYFPESHQWSEISSLSKVILVLRKARNHKALNPGCKRAESPGWFDILPKNSARDMMHEQVCCCNEAANLLLPIALAIFVILHIST